MNPNTAIKAVNISKQYRLGEVGTGTLTHDLNRAWARLRGKEDPFLKIGESNDRSTKGESDYVWSLKDINFEIEKGDAVGIIGRNGAGKSTLLKLLSRVTKPTTGHFEVQGRIASLLEVGTGFNPEMTGRENIFLNGAILGMRRNEIKRKFDEIVDFAGVERYIDTPVKRYSSGMYVRLAFAVAAHLESEILIVDEVLAVGDAEFQKKCLGKMGDMSKGEGRTVLFVSHNMASVKTLTQKSIFLKDGKLIDYDDTDKIVLKYLSDGNTEARRPLKANNREIFISDFYFSDAKSGQKLDVVLSGQDLDINIEITNLSAESYTESIIAVGVLTLENIYITSLKSEYVDKFYTIYPGVNFIKCRITKLPLMAGTFSINGLIQLRNGYRAHYEDIIRLNVENGVYYSNGKIPKTASQIFLINQSWE